MQQTATDSATAQRIRQEFNVIAAAVQGKGLTGLTDPLGQDGDVTLVMNNFRSTGAGDVVMLKDDGSGDRRWTRFRSWGSTSGTDYVEKSSYLKKADGAIEFHRKRVEPQDVVLTSDAPDGDDQAWIDTLH